MSRWSSCYVLRPSRRLNLDTRSQPKCACPNCWRAWLNTKPRTMLGYCWHGKVAWRVKSGALAVVDGVTREEHRAMLEYANEMESVAMPLGGLLVR